MIVTGPSSPDDPKVKYRLPDLAEPVFAATMYGVVQVVSWPSGGLLQVVAFHWDVIHPTLDCIRGTPQLCWTV